MKVQGGAELTSLNCLKCPSTKHIQDSIPCLQQHLWSIGEESFSTANYLTPNINDIVSLWNIWTNPLGLYTNFLHTSTTFHPFGYMSNREHLIFKPISRKGFSALWTSMTSHQSIGCWEIWRAQTRIQQQETDFYKWLMFMFCEIKSKLT